MGLTQLPNGPKAWPEAILKAFLELPYGKRAQEIVCPYPQLLGHLEWGSHAVPWPSFPLGQYAERDPSHTQRAIITWHTKE